MLFTLFYLSVSVPFRIFCIFRTQPEALQSLADTFSARQSLQDRIRGDFRIAISQIPGDSVGGDILTEFQIRIFRESSLITVTQLIGAHVHSLRQSRIPANLVVSLIDLITRGTGAIQPGIRSPIRFVGSIPKPFIRTTTRTV